MLLTFSSDSLNRIPSPVITTAGSQLLTLRTTGSYPKEMNRLWLMLWQLLVQSRWPLMQIIQASCSTAQVCLKTLSIWSSCQQWKEDFLKFKTALINTFMLTMDLITTSIWKVSSSTQLCNLSASISPTAALAFWFATLHIFCLWVGGEQTCTKRRVTVELHQTATPNES